MPRPLPGTLQALVLLVVAWLAALALYIVLLAIYTLLTEVLLVV